MEIVIRKDLFVITMFLWGILASCAVLSLIKIGVHTQYIYAMKDVVVYMSFVVTIPFWLNKQRSQTKIFILFIYLLVLLANWLVINPNYGAPLNNIRQLLSPILLLLMFNEIEVNSKEFFKIANCIFYILIFVVTFGIVDINMSILEHVDLSTYFRLKGIPVNGQGLSYMFYEPILGYSRRMVATFLDPISAGHFFATIFSFYYFYNLFGKKVRFTALMLSSVGMLFCFSKGAFLQVIIACFLLNNNISLLFRFFITLIAGWVLFDRISQGYFGATVHLTGAINALKSITIFGYGIGSVGNYAKMFSDDLQLYHELRISDTFLGSLIGQVGFIGATLWIILIFYVAGAYEFKSKSISFKILASILIVSFFSENTMNVTSFLVPSLVIGLSANYDRILCRDIRSIEDLETEQI